jgi:predicted MFS family arabinose efflux permease
VTIGPARRATSAMFLICGTATSSWAPMVPFAKDRLALDEAALGFILLAFGGGSTVAMPLAGIAIHHWGSRRVVLIAALGTCAALPFLAVPITPLLLAITLFAFGAALGALDVAMNAQAIAVQHAAGRPIMSRFHALFSLGGIAGAALVSLFLRSGLGLVQCAVMIAMVMAVLAIVEQRRLVNDLGGADAGSFTIVPKAAVLFLGALCFMTFLGEGAVLDWSAVFLREHRRVDVSLAGMGYAVFSVAMTVCRLTGDAMTHRFGSTRMLRIGGALACAGFLAVALVPSTAAALAGLAVVGIGAANIVPVLFSGAGRVPGVPPGIALATVTTIAYAGLLLGPALIGFVADATNLSLAFGLVAGLFAVVSLSAARVR